MVGGYEDLRVRAIKPFNDFTFILSGSELNHSECMCLSAVDDSGYRYCYPVQSRDEKWAILCAIFTGNNILSFAISTDLCYDHERIMMVLNN